MSIFPAPLTVPAVTCQPSHGIALLVDGENIPRSCAVAILGHLKPLGPPRIRRVYGSSAHISGWEDHGFRICTSRPGKNSADMLLCVEAMTLALREGVHTIALASADRDFSYLAEQLREIGHSVIGIRKASAPVSFRKSCSAFYLIGDQKAGTNTQKTGALSSAPKPAATPLPPDQERVKSASAALYPATKLVPMVRKILKEQSVEDGWGNAEWLQRRLRAGNPDFRLEDYTSSCLEDILIQLNHFETRLEQGKHLKSRIRSRSPEISDKDVYN